MKSQIVCTSKGQIEYTLAGNGPVVLVCHGTSADCFSNVISGTLLNAGFSVLTPSRPGYGRTPLDVGRSTAQAAEALIALLDHLGIQTCSVVAISGGGPTGIALTANFPQRVTRLVLAVAVTRPENRPSEIAYKNQMAFYGPAHNLMWAGLGLMSRLSPRSTARQTLAIFSTHNPDEGMNKLSKKDIETISRFYQGRSSRNGALNDATHTVGADLLQKICQPTLIVHGREDGSVPFSHAEWAMKYILRAELCETGITGHFFWVDPEFPRIAQRMVGFLQSN